MNLASFLEHIAPINTLELEVASHSTVDEQLDKLTYTQINHDAHIPNLFKFKLLGIVFHTLPMMIRALYW